MKLATVVSFCYIMFLTSNFYYLNAFHHLAQTAPCNLIYHFQLCAVCVVYPPPNAFLTCVCTVLGCYFIMGGRLGTVNNELSTLVQNYVLLQQIPTDNVSFWEEKNTRREVLLRELCFNDREHFEKTLLTLEEKKLQLNGCSHVAKLIDFKESSQAQFCATFHKIYVFFEYPQRTLEDEINQRIRLKTKFEEKELWSILASCILGMSHLQKKQIRHSTLRSNTILIDRSGLIKVSDPFALGLISNYDALLNKRSIPHIYLSPQLTLSLLNEQIVSDANPYKSDIWTLGMIILEAGLMQYQDQCYRDQFSRIYWDALNYNLKLFSERYSADLTIMIQLMLCREESERQDWICLSQHVMKVDEDVRKSFVSNPRLTKSNAINKNPKQITPLPSQGTKPQTTPKPKTQMHFSRTKGSFDSSTFNPTFPVLTPSDISHSRPSRNVFPTPTFQFKTKFDENLVVVENNDETEGEFVVEVFSMGSRYEGNKVKGMRHGQGSFYYQDGGMYEGQWVYNRMQGQGKLFYQSGRLAYEGSWNQDKFQGKGTLHNEFPQALNKPFNYRDLNNIEEYWVKYEGTFKEDLKSGKGVLTFTNGEYYQGEFEDDAIHGLGSFFTYANEEIKGRWANNYLIG